MSRESPGFFVFAEWKDCHSKRSDREAAPWAESLPMRIDSDIVVDARSKRARKPVVEILTARAYSAGVIAFRMTSIVTM